MKLAEVRGCARSLAGTGRTEVSLWMGSFGRWLFDHRKACGLTQAEVASRAGCSKSYLSMLERDQPHPSSGSEIRPSQRLVDSLAVAVAGPLREARLRAGYSPPDANDRYALLGRRLDEILAGTEGAYRERIEQALEDVAKAMVAGAR